MCTNLSRKWPFFSALLRGMVGFITTTVDSRRFSRDMSASSRVVASRLVAFPFRVDRFLVAGILMKMRCE
jgi:hypothetical protein